MAVNNPYTVANGYQSRGTIGTANDNTTVRIDQEQMLHRLVADLAFWHPEWCVQATIPKKQNERIHWDINNGYTSGSAVYLIDDEGLQRAGTNSAGNAQTAGAAVPTMGIQMSTIEATPKRYGAVFQYTAVAASVSKRDMVEWATNEMGILVAEQMDALTKSLFDANSRDLYPRAAITADNSASWATTDTFGYAYLVKIEQDLKIAKLRPPKGAKRYPMIIPPDAQANLLLDTLTAQLMRDTAERANPMAEVFAADFIGSLRCFDFFVSNRLTGSSFKNDASVPGGRAYIYTDEAIGALAMDDPDYGTMPDASNTRNPLGGRDWDSEMPRPVQVRSILPGTSGIADVFGDKGIVAEKHTIGLQSLVAGRLVRAMFATGTTSDYGVGATGGVGLV